VSDWRWISSEAATAIHEEQLAEWGGGTGTRDEGGLLSALARPQNLAAYGEPDAGALAAAYASGVCRNHPFIDGNKRTAWVLARLFLAKNGQALVFQEADATVRMLALAAGELGEDQFADWLRERITQA
jgi:death on curing protein